MIDEETHRHTLDGGPADAPASGVATSPDSSPTPGGATSPDGSPGPESTAAPGDALPPAERGANRSHRPTSEAFRSFIASGWAPRPAALPDASPAAPYAAARRRRLSALFRGDRLVVPAGPLVTRSNDTDYRFRPHSAFAHLTGLGTDREPDAVLVLHPTADGHEAVLYTRPRAERDSKEFYADARYGELWVGVRPSLEEIAATTGLRCAHIDDLIPDLAAGDAGHLRVATGADPAVEAIVAGLRRSAAPQADDQAEQASWAGQDDRAHQADPDDHADQDRAEAGAVSADEAPDPDADARPLDEAPDPDAALVEALSELRLVKDAFEIAELRRAVAATAAGFADIVRALPRASGHARGERVIEGVFGARAREDGNAVGYDTIAAAGDHACTLHWIRNDGPVRPGDLVLVDAGVEVDSLYTADVTRTIPVTGTFTEPQRRVYQAVLDAADAAFAVVRPGARFRDAHEAAMAVIAARLAEWGLLPSSAAESLAPEGQYHRRWMVHGTSHHLGLDVHDCAQARREAYLDGVLEPGMVFTIEPGLYFKADDLLVPEELRGIGVRIEDDVLVTADGVENLTASLPRRPDEVEAWMRDLRAQGPSAR